MPTRRLSYLRSTAILLIVGLVALLGIVGTTIWLVERTQGYVDEVMLIREGRSASADLLNAVMQAESAQRGFLLTGDETYLVPYDEARAQVMPLYDRVRQVLIPFPQANDAVAQLNTALAAKLVEMDRTIELVRDGQAEEARALVRTDEGQALMTEARTFLDALIAAADARLVQGVEEQRGSAGWLRIVAVIGAVAIVAVVGAAVWVALGYTRELFAARAAVEAANASLEDRVRERTADLARANEEIQRFAYIVTHDLRAPLVNIMGFTSELESSLGALQAVVDRAGNDDDPIVIEAKRTASEDLPEAIGFIRSSTRKMDGLINAILKLSREGRRTLRPERVDLEAVLKTATAAVQHQVTEAGGEVTLDLSVKAIVSDRLSLEQSLGNLLDNAIKYRSPARALAVSIRSREETGNRVVIEVEDNGRGIAETDKERVFELFRRSGQQDQAGEGIGLAHVRTMVRSLGGDVTLQSELGKGTTFRVSLPRDLRSVLGSSAA